MEIKPFVKEFDHYRNTYFRTPFVGQLFAVHLSVEHLSMADSIKLDVI